VATRLHYRHRRNDIVTRNHPKKPTGAGVRTTAAARGARLLKADEGPS